MKNYRIIYDKKTEKYSVQVQGLFNLWFRITQAWGDWLVRKKTYRLATLQVVLTTFLIVMMSLIQSEIILILGGIIFTIYFCFLMFFLIGGFAEGWFLKKTYWDEPDAKHCVEKMIKENKKRSEYEKTGRTKIVGVMIDGEYIDGKKLERWKKLDRVVDNNDNALK